jgi:Holliday junction resolvase RusA-like endonuclease
MLSSLKAAFDGLADAGLIADDSGLTHLPVIVKVDKLNPRVELHIVEGDHLS